MNRRLALGAMLGALAAPSLVRTAAAQSADWRPDRPIRLVVPFGPGGPSDIVARILVPRDLESRVLYEDHYVWALRAGHPLAGQPPTLQDFCAVPQVFLGYGSSTLDDLIDETLARAGLRRRVQMAVSSFGQIV